MLNSFQAQGLTQSIAGTSSGSAPLQVGGGSQQGVWVANPTTQAAYLAFGSSAVLATYPTSAAPSTGLCLPSGQAHAFTCPPAGYLSVATSGGGINVFATPGFGL